jgi:hypothetical protein
LLQVGLELAVRLFGTIHMRTAIFQFGSFVAIVITGPFLRTVVRLPMLMSALSSTQHLEGARRASHDQRMEELRFEAS